jgi:hypothetical protein
MNPEGAITERTSSHPHFAIAGDLTGALEIGAKFAAYGLPHLSKLDFLRFRLGGSFGKLRFGFSQNQISITGDFRLESSIAPIRRSSRNERRERRWIKPVAGL